MPCNYKRHSLTVGHSFGRWSWDEGGASVTHPPVVLCIIKVKNEKERRRKMRAHRANRDRHTVGAEVGG